VHRKGDSGWDALAFLDLIQPVLPALLCQFFLARPFALRASLAFDDVCLFGK
jgi:hypothetical protein